MADDLLDPRIDELLNAKCRKEIRVPASFFTATGWQPDKPYYVGIFDPSSMWKNKKRGILAVAFEGDDNVTKTTLRILFDSHFTVTTPTQQFTDDSSDEDQPIANLAQGNVTPGRRAAAAAREVLDGLSPAGSVGSDSSVWSPIRPRQPDSSDDSSSMSSPLAEQPTPGSAPASVNQPRRSPRLSPRRAAAAEPEQPEPAEPEFDSSDEEAEELEAARSNFGKEYPVTTKDPKQPVKKVVWTLTDPKALGEDVREEYPGTFGSEYPAVLLNFKSSPLKPFDVYGAWKHLLPPTWLQKFVDTANRSLTPGAIDPNYRLTTVPEMECVLGLQLAAAVHGGAPFDSYFSSNDFDSSGLFPAPGFGRHGINKNRALVLLRSAHLSDGPMQPGTDPHWFIDGPLAEFNEHMQASLRPSHLGCMDETGCVWRGGESEGDFKDCPHITVVKRKPEPIVAEFNDVCCASSCIMMKMEFEKAAKYHKATEHFDLTGTYNAAMTVRLSAPFAKKNAVVYGDSRFGSVKAAYFNKKVNNVHSMFDIKTGTSLFPRKELVRLCPKEHGALVVMTAKISEGLEGRTVYLYAIAQRRGPAVHTFLTTCGSFAKAIPARFNKVTKVADAPWTTVKVLNKITQAQPGIDKFNRTAFDQLGMHDAFVTRCFETRFSQHFMMSITYVNAINCAKYFNPELYTKDTVQKSLLLELAGKMVRNEDWLLAKSNPKDGPDGFATRAGTKYGEVSVSINGGPPSRESPCKHTLIPLAQIEGYRGGKQQRCYECNEPCSWACARCSTRHCIIALHPPVAQGSKRKYGCLAAHRRNPMGGGYKEHAEEVTGTSQASERRRKIDIQFL